jgi:hypothetical protein
MIIAQDICFEIVRQFNQNFYPDTISGICYVFPVIHIMTNPHHSTTAKQTSKSKNI